MGFPDGVAELCSAPLTAGKVFVESMPWLRIFPGEACKLGLVRRWLASLLADGPAQDEILIVATELATNAIQHTASGGDGYFAVEITARFGTLRIAVADGGSTGEPVLLASSAADESGRGLLLVRGLSTRLGVCGDHRGRLVWAEVPRFPASAARPGYGPGERALRQLRDDGII